MLKSNIAPCFFCVALCLLLGCDNNYTLENLSSLPSQKTFKQAPGFKLDYDLYLPSSYTGWEPALSNKFIYDPKQQAYVIDNLDISHAPIDNFGDRFKITSIDWQHEFGFTNTNAYSEESKFGIIKNSPSIFNIKHYSLLAPSKDIYFELPQNSVPEKLIITLKIITETYPQHAWLMVTYVGQ